MTSRRILIIGGTTRAAADSVRRAGWQPVCADLFADLDLRATAEIIRVNHYPDSLPDDVAQVRADGWFYCGALENHPEVIDRMLANPSPYGPLLGSSPQALRFVRNPQRLSNLLRSEGMTTLEIADQSAPPEPDGSWLQKPLASAGGRLIRIWNESAGPHSFPGTPLFSSPCARSRRVRNLSVPEEQCKMAGYIARTRGPQASRPPSEFSYCGSCGPLEGIPSPIRLTLTRIAEILAKNVVGLQGLVGLDFRLDEDNVWLTEVNPRYTASVEVLELATRRSLLNLDQNTCEGPPMAGRVESSSPTKMEPMMVGLEDSTHPALKNAFILNEGRSIVVKQVLYAWRPLTAPDLSRWMVTDNPWQVPLVADIPVTGIPIEPGWPICTVIASGTSLSSAQASLQRRLTLVWDALESA